MSYSQDNILNICEEAVKSRNFMVKEGLKKLKGESSQKRVCKND